MSQLSLVNAVYAAVVAGAFLKSNLPTELQLPAAALLFVVWTWLSSPRKPEPFKGVSDEENRRLNITKLRATSKLFPGPYPNGWYYICRSSDLKRGDTLSVTAFGRELAGFRGENGIAGVLNAFCPYLGTHLGYGGMEEGDTLVCPYHSWAFNKDGECKQIPYCDREMRSLGNRVNAPAFSVCERSGMLFAWYHADNAKPAYTITMLDEIEEKGMYMVGDFAVPDWHCHIMEFAQNSTDWYHFRTVHKWLGQPENHKIKMLKVQHTCKTSMPNLKGCTEKDGSKIPEEIIFMAEQPTKMSLFGVIPIPSFLYSHFSAEARFQGPQLSVFSIDSPFVGAIRVFFTFTPEKPFLQRCTVRCFASPWVPRWLASLGAMNSIATVEQDRIVWEHKMTIAPRNLVQGDGPFAGMHFSRTLGSYQLTACLPLHSFRQLDEAVLF